MSKAILPKLLCHVSSVSRLSLSKLSTLTQTRNPWPHSVFYTPKRVHVVTGLLARGIIQSQHMARSSWYETCMRVCLLSWREAAKTKNWRYVYGCILDFDPYMLGNMCCFVFFSFDMIMKACPPVWISLPHFNRMQYIISSLSSLFYTDGSKISLTPFISLSPTGVL